MSVFLIRPEDLKGLAVRSNGSWAIFLNPDPRRQHFCDRVGVFINATTVIETEQHSHFLYSLMMLLAH